MTEQRNERASVKKFNQSKKSQFTECVQGLLRHQSGGHAGYACNVHHNTQIDLTYYETSRVEDSTQMTPEQLNDTSTIRPSLFSRFKRAIVQAVLKAKNPPQIELGPEGSFEPLGFKKAEGEFPFKNSKSLFPCRETVDIPLSSVYNPFANSGRPLSIVLETVAQLSQTVLIPDSLGVSVHESEDILDDDQADKRVKEEMAVHKAKEVKIGRITRNRKGTNRKREHPRRVGPYQRADDGLYHDPFIGPLQRSMSNAKKDLKRTLSKPPFIAPPSKPSAEASISSEFLAQFWDCDSDVEVRSSHSTVE